MKLMIDKFQYEYCATLIWGVIPIDQDWAQDTSIFKEKAPKLLLEYDAQKEREWNIKIKSLTKVNLIDVLAESIQKNNTSDAWDQWQKSKDLRLK